MWSPAMATCVFHLYPKCVVVGTHVCFWGILPPMFPNTWGPGTLLCPAVLAPVAEVASSVTAPSFDAQRLTHYPGMPGASVSLGSAMPGPWVGPPAASHPC